MEIEFAPVFFVQIGEIVPDRLLLFEPAEGWVSQQRQQIIFLRSHVRLRVVLLFVDVNVVIGIMRRNPGKYRKAIKYGKEIIGENVEPFDCPHCQVLVVVDDGGHDDRHQQLEAVTEYPKWLGHFAAILP